MLEESIRHKWITCKQADTNIGIYVEQFTIYIIAHYPTEHLYAIRRFIHAD